MIINNKFLFNSNLYRYITIKKGKRGLCVNVGGNVFKKDVDEFEYIKDTFFSQPTVDIVKNIKTKDELEQADIITSYFARSTTLNNISNGKCLTVTGYDKELKLYSYGKVVKKLVDKYNEDRMRFYGKNMDSNSFILDVTYSDTGYLKSDGKTIFRFLNNIADPKYRETRRLNLIPIDEKFLKTFLKEQIIDKDGKVIKEYNSFYPTITIGNTTIKYWYELEEVIRIALLKRENRISNEKRMQYKLDI